MQIKRTEQEIQAKLEELYSAADNPKSETQEIKIWTQIYFIQWLEGKRAGSDLI